MFVSFKGTLVGVARWQWRSLLLYAAVSTTVFCVGHFGGYDRITIDNLPVTVLGAALGIFVSFRTNAGYDRWWEGRKLWGRLVNASRHFTTQVTTYLQGDGAAAQGRTLVRRHVAYVHALRCMLRGQDLWQDEDFLAFCDDEVRAALEGQRSTTHALLQLQQVTLVRLADEGALNELRLQSLDATIQELLGIQGGCERIRNTPFPRAYGFIATRLVWIYSGLLPVCIMEEMGFLTVPITMLVCLGFSLIGEVGRVLEDPFTMNWPALPLSALSRTIQVNLQQRLGDEDLPPMLQPDERGVLM